MKILIATKNPHKILEIRSILSEYNIDVVPVDVEKIEIQAEDVSEVAKIAAKYAASKIGKPIVVEDAGLFIDALKGFPGPFSAYVFKTLGNYGIIKLMRGISNRRARFISAVAFAFPNGCVRLFIGVTEGIISETPKGNMGFGFDPIFIPLEGDGRTYAEMNLKEKNKISHRGKAFRSLARWITKQGDMS